MPTLKKTSSFLQEIITRKKGTYTKYFAFADK